jgi:hypothetical protein
MKINVQCAETMCRKDANVRDEPDKKKEEEQQQLENNSISTIIVEQINGTCYTFNTAYCALMFKKFRDIWKQFCR